MKIIILDRDGTLNEDTGYLHEPEKAVLCEGAAEGLKKLAAEGFRFVVVSNQSGIGRGYFTERELNATNEKIASLFAEQGVKIDAFFCCPHLPEEGCSCRKPETGLVEQAEKKLGFSRSDIFCAIGDKKSDVQLAEKLKVPSVLVFTGYGKEQYEKGVRGTYNARDLNEAADILIGVLKK